MQNDAQATPRAELVNNKHLNPSHPIIALTMTAQVDNPKGHTQLSIIKLFFLLNTPRKMFNFRIYRYNRRVVFNSHGFYCNKGCIKYGISLTGGR